MKVLNLGCGQSHVFEGWFASEEDFQTQLARGLIECPMCGDRHVEKRLSAPRLNLKTQGSDVPASRPSTPVDTTPAAGQQPALPAVLQAKMLQAKMLQAMRELVANTEDVGERFAQEARRMHYGEIEHRGIRGRTTVDEAVALADEGVELLPLPDLDAIKNTLQ